MPKIDEYPQMDEFTMDEKFLVETPEGTRHMTYAQIVALIKKIHNENISGDITGTIATMIANKEISFADLDFELSKKDMKESFGYIPANSEELYNESIDNVLSENKSSTFLFGEDYWVGDTLRFRTTSTGDRDYCIECYKTNDYEELEFSDEDIVIEIVDDSIVRIIVGAYTTVHRTRTTVLGEVRQLKETIGDLKTSGLTTAQVNALDGMFKKCAFTGDVTAEYEAFKTAFGITESGGEEEPETPVEPTTPTLTSISATYSGGEVTVGTALTDLTGITVTATYSDGTTANVTDYTLSGSIVEGSNTIAVSYGGKTTTFAVVGVVESGNAEITMTKGALYKGSDSTLYSDGGNTVNTSLSSRTGAFWYSDVFEEDTVVSISQTYDSNNAGLKQYAVSIESDYDVTNKDGASSTAVLVGYYMTEIGSASTNGYTTTYTVKAGYRLAVLSVNNSVPTSFTVTA